MKMEILGASAPAWGDEAQTVITLQVRLSHMPDEVIPFSAHRDDVEEHGRELFARALHGAYGSISPYSGPSSAELEALAFLDKVEAAQKETAAKIAPLERAVRFGMATDKEKAELESLERYSVALMRAEGPDLPARV